MITQQLLKYTLLIALASLLSACLGGSIAQQIVRTMLTSTADKVVANAVDEQERKDILAKQNAPLKDTVPDPYWAAFLTSGFEQVQAIVTPLPTTSFSTSEEAQTSSTPQFALLVQVELFNFLIGEEKNKLLEKARVLGATTLPIKSEWQNWQVGMGIIEGNKKMITFLIPPEFGKMQSGAKVTVEIASLGELNMLRYAYN